MSVCLQDEFGFNAETQKLLCKNGETLLGAVNFFVSSINTLVNKTMEDTLMTVKMYENARSARKITLTEGPKVLFVYLP